MGLVSVSHLHIADQMQSGILLEQSALCFLCERQKGNNEISVVGASRTFEKKVTDDSKLVSDIHVAMSMWPCTTLF